MRKTFFTTLFAVTIALAAVSSCQNKSTELNPVAEPSWYNYETYFKEKTTIFADLPIYNNDIVMLGDEIIDFGEWEAFFNDTCMVNRGIMYEGSPHTLYRVDGIAAAAPSKIFVSTGLMDFMMEKDDSKMPSVASEVSKNVLEIFSRAKIISPETELYFMSIIPDRQVTAAAVEAIKTANETIKAGAKDFTYIDMSSMTDASGMMDESLTFDKRSLNGLGYEKLCTLIENNVGLKHVNVANDHKYTNMSPAHKDRATIFNSLPKKTHSVMFLGNSITRRGPWNELIPVVRTTNRGIGGDVLKGIYNRLDDVIEDEPTAIFIMAGINDLNNPKSNVDEAWTTYQQIIEKLTKELPSTSIFVQSTLPVTAEYDKDTVTNAKVAELNKYLEAAADKYEYTYLDIASLLSDENGCLKPEYTFDGLHPIADAYFIWSTKIIDSGDILVLSQMQKARMDTSK